MTTPGSARHLSSPPPPTVTPAARTPLETEDEYGDALADIDATVYLVLLDTAEPLVHWLSWYDLRATLEQPGVPAAERVRKWRSLAAPSNYVYRVKDRWYGPMLEPLSRHYNSFVVAPAMSLEIGTSVGSSQLHGAREAIHAVYPIHRADVRAYLAGTMTGTALRARLHAQVPFLSPAADAHATYRFTPAPDDRVGPAAIMTRQQLGLARVFDSRLSGYGSHWLEGRGEYRRCFDGLSLADAVTDRPQHSGVPAHRGDDGQRPVRREEQAPVVHHDDDIDDFECDEIEGALLGYHAYMDCRVM